MLERNKFYLDLKPVLWPRRRVGQHLQLQRRPCTQAHSHQSVKDCLTPSQWWRNEAVSQPRSLLLHHPQSRSAFSLPLLSPWPSFSLVTSIASFTNYRWYLTPQQDRSWFHWAGPESSSMSCFVCWICLALAGVVIVNNKHDGDMFGQRFSASFYSESSN